MLHDGPSAQTNQLGDSLQKLQVVAHSASFALHKLPPWSSMKIINQYSLLLQVAVQNLQTSINQHQHLVNPKNSIDALTLLKYAHKIAYTSFAPLNHEASQPLPPNVRPPNPQDWQFRSSQLHQFQGTAVAFALPYWSCLSQ